MPSRRPRKRLRPGAGWTLISEGPGQQTSTFHQCPPRIRPEGHPWGWRCVLLRLAVPFPPEYGVGTPAATLIIRGREPSDIRWLAATATPPVITTNRVRMPSDACSSRLMMFTAYHASANRSSSPMLPRTTAIVPRNRSSSVVVAFRPPPRALSLSQPANVCAQQTCSPFLAAKHCCIHAALWPRHSSLCPPALVCVSKTIAFPTLSISYGENDFRLEIAEVSDPPGSARENFIWIWECFYHNRRRPSQHC